MIATILFALLVPPSVIDAQGIEVNEYFKSKDMREVCGRIICLTPSTRWVNVAQSEIIKFVDRDTGASFIWNVDNPYTWTTDLASVAPAGLLAGRKIPAYVSARCDCEWPDRS